MFEWPCVGDSLERRDLMVDGQINGHVSMLLKIQGDQEQNPEEPHNHLLILSM